ncbi:MAG: hypothetical protein M3Y82_06075 [Verrucomicrobiota bacterium]|nr:hypothetical protein [Verrucomicrobiota bacterium]
MHAVLDLAQVEIEDIRVIQMLLDAGANAELKNDQGETALMMAKRLKRKYSKKLFAESIK